MVGISKIALKDKIAPVAATLIFTLCIPVIMNIYFKSDLNPAYYLMPLLIVTLINTLKYYGYGRIQKLASILILITYTIFTGALVIYIASIPYPAYAAWIELVKKEATGGIISTLFLLGLTYFSTIISSTFLKKGYIKQIAAIIFIISFFLLIIHQNLLMSIITTLSGIINIIISLMLKNDTRLKPVIPALILSGLIIILSLLLTSIYKDEIGWMRHYTLDPELRKLVEKLVPNFPRFSGIEGMGAYGERILGNDTDLSPGPVFLVKSPKYGIHYLRSRVYDVYTGYSWQQSPEVLDEAHNYDSYFRIPFNQTPDFTITTIIDYYSFIPHTLATSNIGITGKNSFNLRYGGKKSGFKFELPVIKNTTFSLYENDNRSKVPLGDDDAKRYQALSRFMPESVKELAKKISKDNDNPEEILIRINEYLESEYTYSLNQNLIDESSIDFVENFLFNNTSGSCQHFASALIMLARINGINARYVSGYIVNIDPKRGYSICTGLTKHAWPEVWLPGKGWTTWEATPPIRNFTSYTNPDAMFNPEDDPIIAQQLQAVWGAQEDSQAKEGTKRNHPLFFGIALLSIITLFIITFFIFGMIKRMITLRSHYSKDKEVRRIQLCMEKMFTLTSKAGIPGPARSGYEKWFKKIKKRYKADDQLLKSCYTLVIKTFYSEKRPIIPDEDGIQNLNKLLKLIKTYKI